MINKNFYFPCFFSWDVKLNIDNQKILNECLQIQKNDPIGIKKSNRYGWHSNFLSEELQDLQKEILNFASYCLTDLKMNNSYSIEHFWINMNKKGQSNELHDHGCVLFGTYYVKCKSNGAPLILYPEINHDRMRHILLDENQKEYVDSMKIVYPPEEKKIVMWFGNMLHEVLENEDDDDRISVGFNIKLDSPKV